MVEHSGRTRAAYTRSGRRFEILVLQLGLPLNATGYVKAMLHEGRPLRDATWRFMRAAVKWWIGHRIGEAEATRFTEIFATQSLPKTPKKRYPKRLPHRVANDLITALRAGRFGRCKQIAADMLEAGAATGLRPVEWASAQLNGNTLRVTNAKYRPGFSGNGKERVLHLVDGIITDQQRDAIRRLIIAMKGLEWDQIGPNIRRAFNKVKVKLQRSKLLTKSESKTRIYEARHQFSADAKMSMDYRGGEVAAAMGQRSAMTAKTAYGNGRWSRGRSGIRPSKSSVAAVDLASIGRLQRSLMRVSEFMNRAIKTFSSGLGNAISPGINTDASSTAVMRSSKGPDSS